MAGEDHIVAGFDGSHRGFADRTNFADRAHLEIIGENDALVACFPSEKLLDDFLGERRGGLGRGI